MIPRPPIALVLAALLITAPVPAAAQDDTEVGPTFLLSLGGKLYDDLWLILDLEPPAGRNPGFPADAEVGSSRETWRCVTCHGWSYSGGNVASLPVPALTGLAGTDPEVIAAKILDKAHPFPAQDIPELSLQLLAYFISEGLYNRSEFLDENGRGLGNPEFGQAIFEGACINCHQLDGRRYLKGEHGDRSSLGWVVRNRPEQALHKILNGVPGAEMLSLRFLPTEQIADLIAYLQALDPAEK
jgi:hypothetical protein